MSLPNKNKHKVIVNVALHNWVTKKFLHSRLPKTALNSIFSPFYLTKKHIEDFYKKNCIKELCKNHLKMTLLNYVEFHIHAEKDHLFL